MLLFFLKRPVSSDGTGPSPTPTDTHDGVDNLPKKPVSFDYATYRYYQEKLKKKYPTKKLVESKEELATPPSHTSPQIPAISSEQILNTVSKLVSSAKPSEYERRLAELARLADLVLDNELRKEMLMLAEFERLKRLRDEEHKKLLLMLLQDE